MANDHGRSLSLHGPLGTPAVMLGVETVSEAFGYVMKYRYHSADHLVPKNPCSKALDSWDGLSKEHLQLGLYISLDGNHDISENENFKN